MMSQRIAVELGERRYEIVVGRGLSAELREYLDSVRQAGRPVAWFIDGGVARHLSPEMAACMGDDPRMEFPPGETTKESASLVRCWDFLAQQRIDRSGLVAALGGGVVGDLSGFAAASYLRGIGFLQVPTTLLAMVDSSVGGKTGINLEAGKNLAGAFHQPDAVYADLDLLRTLPPREFSAGMAEVIKYGMLADRELFHQLAEGPRLSPDRDGLGAVVGRCCHLKAEIVRDDEREEATGSGGRALLNLGHTFAHAIEAVAGYGEYLHGEAVAVGLVCATALSRDLGKIPGEALDTVAGVLERYGLPVRLREPLPGEALLAAMMRDKKVRAGKLRFVAMEEIGRAIVVGDVDRDTVGRIWSEIGAA